MEKPKVSNEPQQKKRAQKQIVYFSNIFLLFFQLVQNFPMLLLLLAKYAIIFLCSVVAVFTDCRQIIFFGRLKLCENEEGKGTAKGHNCPLFIIPHNNEPLVCIGENLHTVMEWNILCYWIMDIVKR